MGDQKNHLNEIAMVLLGTQNIHLYKWIRKKINVCVHAKTVRLSRRTMVWS